MSTKVDRLVENYRRELRRELVDLPRASRREVLDEIDEHIAEARAELDGENETAIRNILERLGDPAAIAEDARERFGLYRRPAGWREIAALALLSVGGLLLFWIGWVGGVILLWASDAWTSRQKLVGTLLSATGPMVPSLLIADGQPPFGRAVADGLLLTLFLAPLLVAVWLGFRMRRPAPATA